ncbi:MAG: GntR family transcriptional regulator [Clostridia bacterium]|nr:GntR family transcriptional regulator [Clostridia bacterium]
MFQLDLRSGVPICDQIVNGFVKLKAIGVISGGEKLPSVRSLALKFSINPNTVQKAYAILESGGIIYSVKGKGSFVSEDESAAQAVIDRAKKDFGAAVKSAREVGLDANTLTAIVKDIYKEEKIC